MNRIRVVLDTNVFLVSLAPGFRLHWIFTAIIENRLNLCVSNEIIAEYEEIIERRYGLSRSEAILDFLLLLPNVELITPYYRWNLIPEDEEDNKFVDCAIAGNADFVVSNDRDFQVLKKVGFPPVRVLTADEFDAAFRKPLME